MALVSGRPISFKMDLYNPLYVARPTVEPELFASLRPVAYGGALRKRGEDVTKDAPADEKSFGANGIKGRSGLSREALQVQGGGQPGGGPAAPDFADRARHA